MKTATFHEDGAIRVEDAPVPEVGPGQVLVEVRSAGICGSDLHYLHGKNPWASPLSWPRRGGHELAGVVVSVGPGVDRVLVGERVGVEPAHLAACGACQPCLRGDSHVCPERGLIDGVRWSSKGFSQLDLAPASHVHRLPDAVSFDEGALADVYACGVHALHRVRDRRLDKVAIIGAGPIGLTVGQLARAAGAKHVVMISRRQASSDLALAVGAADEALTIPPGAPLHEVAGKVGADVVFESVGGNGESTACALELVAPGGVIVILGAFWDDVRVRYAVANRKEIDLRWSNSYSTSDGERDYLRALDAIARGRVNATALVSHRFPLERIADGFVAAIEKRASNAIKVMINPTGGQP